MFVWGLSDSFAEVTNVECYNIDCETKNGSIVVHTTLADIKRETEALVRGKTTWEKMWPFAHEPLCDTCDLGPGAAGLVGCGWCNLAFHAACLGLKVVCITNSYQACKLCEIALDEEK